jgi:hypothetical protein
MRTTARFDINRRKRLKSIFKKEHLVQMWRHVVKEQIRQMELKDLHDYYDFNLSIEARSERIIEDILAGRYKVEPPLIYKMEKKLGICRHLMMPCPSDALVFQVLVEKIKKGVKPPTTKAYYSQAKHSLKLPHEQIMEYTWFENWKKYQKEIWGFARTFDHIVVTDLSNFYDSIEISELRHCISSRVKADEVVLDLMFKMIEQLSWNPDYLPYSGRGLPTINIEAPRFLAHCFLFEVDEVLDSSTKSSFVRWMDDINFAVRSEADAKQTLNEVSDVLKSRGLSFNLSKTKVLTSDQAEKHFWIYENQKIDALHKKIKKSKSRKRIQNRVFKDFIFHIENDLEKTNSGKITKRYFTLLAMLNLKIPLRHCEELFNSDPSLREKICEYLVAIGYDSDSKKCMLNLLKNQKYVDDVQLFFLIETMLAWNIPIDTTGKQFVKSVAAILADKDGVFGSYCRIWFSVKYSGDEELYKLISENKREWMKDSFLSRQVVSALPRLICYNKDFVDKLISEAIDFGFPDSTTVALNLRDIMTDAGAYGKLKWYVLPKNQVRKYQISKVLISMALAANPNLADRDEFLIDIAGLSEFDEWVTTHLYQFAGRV